MSGRTSPMTALFPVLSALPAWLGTYPISAATERIFSASSAETRPLPESALETVAAETPSAVAILVSLGPERAEALSSAASDD
jgi:hypothetical protein